METILITGARAPVALELARSFKQQGHRVLLADSLRLTLGRWSNAVDKYWVLPPPRHQAAAFAAKIKRIIATENVTHLVPTCEEAFYISLFKNELACKTWCAEAELMDALHNKRTFPQVAKPFFHIPETVAVHEFTNWGNSAEYVFKPDYSRFANRVIIGQPIAETFFPEPEKAGWIAQKRIIGQEICLYSVWDAGRLKAYAAYHPLYRVGRGAGIFFAPVSHPAAFGQVKAFGQAMNYTGQLCFDVIVDKSGKPFFIECNPRGTSGAHLIGSGLAAAFLKDGDLELPDGREYSLKCALAVLKPLSFVKQRVRHSTDVVFRRNDPLPSLLQPLGLLEIGCRAIASRTGWLEAATGDIEWNGHGN